MLNKLLTSFCQFYAKTSNAKKKWSAVSVSELQSQKGLGASFKIIPKFMFI